jgi:hypothetical protein
VLATGPSQAPNDGGGANTVGSDDFVDATCGRPPDKWSTGDFDKAAFARYKEKIFHGQPWDLEAYAAFSVGLHHWNRSKTKPDFVSPGQCFQSAVDFGHQQGMLYYARLLLDSEGEHKEQALWWLQTASEAGY